LNERCQGAIEALAWVDRLMERGLVLGWDLKHVKFEVEFMKEEFLNGIADSFQAIV
jgi:hypothetical protein